jgi:hypothetical protein
MKLKELRKYLKDSIYEGWKVDATVVNGPNEESANETEYTLQKRFNSVAVKLVGRYPEYLLDAVRDLERR